MTVMVTSHLLCGVWCSSNGPYLAESLVPDCLLTSTVATTDRSGPQRMGGVEGGVHDYLDGHALYDLDEVARGVFRGKEAEDRAGTGLHAVDVPGRRPARIGVDLYLDGLAHGHFSYLGLLEIGDNPGVRLDDRKKGLPGLNVFARDRRSSSRSFPRSGRGSPFARD